MYITNKIQKIKASIHSFIHSYTKRGVVFYCQPRENSKCGKENKKKIQVFIIVVYQCHLTFVIHSLIHLRNLAKFCFASVISVLRSTVILI